MSEVCLRAITEADLPDLVRWFNDPEVTEHLGRDTQTMTLEEERAWLAHISAPECTERHWAIETDGRHIGECSLNPHRTQKKAGFGIVIGEKWAWGKGYGTAALQEVLRIGFTEMDLHRIELRVFSDNPRGQRCYEKCGFRREGYGRQDYCKDGRWRDTIHMGILREDWEARREAPCADGEVVLRDYRSADHSQVVALWELTGFAPGPNDTAAMIQWKLATQPGFFFVAEKNGQIIGTLVGSLERGWGWIQRVAVHPDCRRGGIAKELMRQAEEAHAALGAYRTVLLTSNENLPARTLYESLGYNTWDGVIVMGRTLTPPEEAREEGCCEG